MNKPFSCQPQQLLLYHYAELDAVEHEQVKQHLQDCSDCRAEMTELQELLRAVPVEAAELRSVDLDRFTTRVMAQIQPRQPWFARPTFGWALAGGATLLLVLNLNLTPPASTPVSNRPSLLMTADPDVLPNMELLQTLELLENFELIQQLGELG